MHGNMHGNMHVNMHSNMHGNVHRNVCVNVRCTFYEIVLEMHFYFYFSLSNFVTKSILYANMYLFKKKFKQTTRLSFLYLLCTVNTTPTVIIHSACHEKHVTLTIMVI